MTEQASKIALRNTKTIRILPSRMAHSKCIHKFIY